MRSSIIIRIVTIIIHIIVIAVRVQLAAVHRRLFVFLQVVVVLSFTAL